MLVVSSLSYQSHLWPGPSLGALEHLAAGESISRNVKKRPCLTLIRTPTLSSFDHLSKIKSNLYRSIDHRLLSPTNLLWWMSTDPKMTCRCAGRDKSGCLHGVSTTHCGLNGTENEIKIGLIGYLSLGKHYGNTPSDQVCSLFSAYWSPTS